jgi:hypothetical protein
MKMMSLRNKFVLRYVNEIQSLEQKIRNTKLKKSEVILQALEQYFMFLLKELIQNYKINKEELANYVTDKELLKRHIIVY